jgi:YVTN family beta-propeller protein
MKLNAWTNFAARVLPAAALAVSASCAVAQQPYQIVDHWMIGGTGGWDYLLADPSAHLLYVTHGTRVEVLDTNTGKVTGAITGLKGTHGIALDDAGKYGYISDGGANAVVVFDRHSFATVTSIPAGTNPDGIVWDPSTKSVWAFNGRSKNATVIDAATNTVVATIPLPGKPEFPAADGRGFVYDNIEDANEIVKMDAKSHTVVATWKLDGLESPSGLAIDRKHHKLFAVCDGKKMAVVDSDSGKLLATPAIGEGPDAANFSDSKQLAFSSNGEGTLSVVDTANNYATIETLPTQRGGRTMSYDDKADRAFVVVAKYGPRPDATPENPRPRPTILPDSFEVLVIGRK